jgi:hypothetical protein
VIVPDEDGQIVPVEGKDHPDDGLAPAAGGIHRIGDNHAYHRFGGAARLLS